MEERVSREKGHFSQQVPAEVSVSLSFFFLFSLNRWNITKCPILEKKLTLNLAGKVWTHPGKDFNCSTWLFSLFSTEKKNPSIKGNYCSHYWFYCALHDPSLHILPIVWMWVVCLLQVSSGAVDRNNSHLATLTDNRKHQQWMKCLMKWLNYESQCKTAGWLMKVTINYTDCICFTWRQNISISEWWLFLYHVILFLQSSK